MDKLLRPLSVAAALVAAYPAAAHEALVEKQSMGSLQAYEWAATYPEMVERVIPVIGSGWAARAGTSDANHFLYLAKANQLFYAGHGETLCEGLLAIDARVLIIQTDEDLAFPGNAVRETAAIIRSDGMPVEIVELEGTRGHLDGVVAIVQAAAQIKAFLETD